MSESNHPVNRVAATAMIGICMAMPVTAVVMILLGAYNPSPAVIAVAIVVITVVCGAAAHAGMWLIGNGHRRRGQSDDALDDQREPTAQA